MTGIQRIAAERRRQTVQEGWTPAHDAGHVQAELTAAACCYAMVSELQMDERCRGESPLPAPRAWPWDLTWWKPSDDPVRNLEKAGALIAAEIDRLLALRPRLPVPAAAVCLDCGLPYEAFPIDVILPRPQWLEIHPAEHGLLCAACIVARAAQVRGAACVHAIIEVAPRKDHQC